MSNEMFKTVILNVFYVMHILKLTFILNFALIGQYILTNRILQWESIMYISSSTICCFAYFNLSRLKLSVTTWPLNLSKRPKMTTSCSRAPSGDHFEEIGHFLGCSIISDFGGLETIKIRWAENPEKIDTVTSEFGSNPHQKGRVKIYEFNLSCKYYIETVLYSKAKKYSRTILRNETWILCDVIVICAQFPFLFETKFYKNIDFYFESIWHWFMGIHK